MFLLLVGTRIGPEFIFMSILTFLVTIGILTPAESLIGMSNIGDGVTNGTK